MGIVLRILDKFGRLTSAVNTGSPPRMVQFTSIQRLRNLPGRELGRRCHSMHRSFSLQFLLEVQASDPEPLVPEPCEDF
jgi:hypothetical protein